MSWQHPTERDWDHVRDLRKHDSLPHRLDVEVGELMEVAIAARQAPNDHVAAGLIDAYADAKAARERLDAVAAGAGR